MTGTLPLFDDERKASGPVECLGQTFPSDEARREHYLAILREKLKDPAFRKIEGFPIGTDEDILALSDPPYYTTCPNPWLADFVEHYGTPYDPSVSYTREPLAIDVEVEREIGWMYETLHSDGRTKGRIEYTVWSEVFTCPECAGEVNFLDEALDKDSKPVRDAFPCPHCGAKLNKDRLERVLETRMNPITGQPWQRVMFRPALISYVVGRMRWEKQPDADDLALLARIDSRPLPPGMPKARFPIEAMYHGSRIAPKGHHDARQREHLRGASRSVALSERDGAGRNGSDLLKRGGRVNRKTEVTCCKPSKPRSARTDR